MLILQSLRYQSIVFTDRIKQGSQFDVSLLYSEGVSFMEVQEGIFEINSTVTVVWNTRETVDIHYYFQPSALWLA